MRGLTRPSSGLFSRASYATRISTLTNCAGLLNRHQKKLAARKADVLTGCFKYDTNSNQRIIDSEVVFLCHEMRVRAMRLHLTLHVSAQYQCNSSAHNCRYE